MSALQPHLLPSLAVSESGVVIGTVVLFMIGAIMVFFALAPKQALSAREYSESHWSSGPALQGSPGYASFFATNPGVQGATEVEQVVRHLLDVCPQPCMRLRLECEGVDAELLGAFVAVAQSDARLSVAILDSERSMENAEPSISIGMVCALDNVCNQRPCEVGPLSRFGRNFDPILQDQKRPNLEIFLILVMLLIFFGLGFRAWIILIM